MPVYRLEIERGETLWITAHNERGAIELASAHLEGEAPLNKEAMVQILRDVDDAIVLEAPASDWATAAREHA